MATSDRAIALLESIDASLKELLRQSKARQASAPKPVASDRDLDGPHGDPTVKFNPRDWTGPSFKGRRFSECPPDFLDLVAQAFDYFGDQAEQKNERTDRGKPVADFKRADAARARGWAKRMRDGRAPRREPVGATAGTPSGWDADDDRWEARH